MKTLPCHGCSERQNPNCAEDCVSYRLWAKAYFRKVYATFAEEERIVIKDAELTYYEPCDESGEPYKKSSLDKKMDRYK